MPFIIPPTIPPTEIETFNKFLVGSNGRFIIIQRSPQQLSYKDALLLAAYLVVIAEQADGEFNVVLNAVKAS